MVDSGKDVPRAPMFARKSFRTALAPEHPLRAPANLHWWQDEGIRERSRLTLRVVFLIIVGITIGANWPYARGLFQFSTFKDFLERVPILGVILAFAGLMYQRERARFNMEIDLCLKVTDKWEGENIRKHRATAARSLLIDGTQDSNSVDAVCDFLEDLGFLVHRRAISERSAWQFFSSIVCPYYEMTIDYRLAHKKTDEVELWSEFERLYLKLQEQERLARARNKIAPATSWSRNELEEYFEVESEISEWKPVSTYGRWRRTASR